MGKRRFKLWCRLSPVPVSTRARPRLYRAGSIAGQFLYRCPQNWQRLFRLLYMNIGPAQLEIGQCGVGLGS